MCTVLSERVVLLAFVASSCLATQPVYAQRDRQAPAEWKQALPIRLAPSSGDSFQDLEPLREQLSRARIVALGEALHGDGTTMRAKLRLVRFLHERCGFDVLAFESGLWDCARAFDALRRGGPDAREMASIGIFACWTQSLQCDGLWRYLAERARSERPLELCGFDCQLTGSAGQSFAEDFAKRIAALTKLDANQVQADLANLVAAIYERDKKFSFDADKVLKPIEKAVAAARKSDESAFILQCVKSLRGFASIREHENASSAAKRFNARDAAMGDNLLWLIEERYPKRKIIVWAATMHVVRKASGITNPGTGNYAGFEPAGTIVAKKLGKDYFVVGFDARRGISAAFPWSRPFMLTQPSPKSLATLVEEARLDDAWIHLRDAKNDKRLAAPLVARPLGHAEMKARWAEHLDAIVSIGEMRPSRVLEGDALAGQDPVDAFASKWRSDLEAIEAGNVYAEKGAPGDAWKNWVDLDLPTRGERVAAQRRFETWVQQAQPHPSLAWRVAEMRAAIADSLGDAEATKAAMNEAVAAYPDKAFAKPMVMSGFQHVIHRRALWLFVHESLSAAIASIVDPLAKDARFAYFYASPWKPLLTPTEKQSFDGAILRALEARAKAFPAEASAIASQMAELRAGR